MGKSKNAADFSIFQPTLEKIVNYKKKFIKRLETTRIAGYDVLLDDFEKGFKAKTMTASFPN